MVLQTAEIKAELGALFEAALLEIANEIPSGAGSDALDGTIDRLRVGVLEGLWSEEREVLARPGAHKPCPCALHVQERRTPVRAYERAALAA